MIIIFALFNLLRICLAQVPIINPSEEAPYSQSCKFFTQY